MLEWQPIETAPKDGTAVLGFYPEFAGYIADQRFRVIHWSGWGGGVWETDSGGKPAQSPTHWMRLPEPPNA